MIKEAYCSFKVAKLLKEKGFDELCIYYYKDGALMFNPFLKGRNSYQTDTCSAPTHQMAMKWLREIYNIDIITFHEKLPNDCYWARIERNLSTEFEQEPEYNSYEDAVEAAIKYCLENLI